MNKLTRSTVDAKIGGVCSGLAKYLEIDSTIIRMFFLLLFFCFGTGVLAYLIMWMVIPKEG